jgi:hypothetical protein
MKAIERRSYFFAAFDKNNHDYPLENSVKKNKPNIFLALLIVLFFGCASHPASNVKESIPKRITDIQLIKSSETLIFTIKANQSLTYTAQKLDFPIGVLLHFSETSLDFDRSVYTPPDNEIVSSIKSQEIFEDKTKGVRIFFALKKESPYNLTNDDAGVKITFPRTTALSDAKPQKKLAVENPPTKIIKKSPPAANYLKTVTARPLKNNIVVNVIADGTINNYQSFTLDHPARIIFDLYSLKSPYKDQQIVEVGSKWIKRIRHFGHPDRVRLVLETEKDYQKKYSALPTDTGLLIHVGKIPASSNQTRQTESDNNSGTERTGQVTLVWNEVPNATSYNVCWSKFPGVNRQNGNKISEIKNPTTTIKGLSIGDRYYFVVTAVKGTAESQESEVLSFTVEK